MSINSYLIPQSFKIYETIWVRCQFHLSIKGKVAWKYFKRFIITNLGNFINLINFETCSCMSMGQLSYWIQNNVFVSITSLLSLTKFSCHYHNNTYSKPISSICDQFLINRFLVVEGHTIERFETISLKHVYFIIEY